MISTVTDIYSFNSEYQYYYLLEFIKQLNYIEIQFNIR